MCRYIGTDISAADIRCIGNADISAFFCRYFADISAAHFNQYIGKFCRYIGKN
jgi:hypothetical protein